jgi:hypothetical protein
MPSPEGPCSFPEHQSGAKGIPCSPLTCGNSLRSVWACVGTMRESEWGQTLCDSPQTSDARYWISVLILIPGFLYLGAKLDDPRG